MFSFILTFASLLTLPTQTAEDPVAAIHTQMSGHTGMVVEVGLREVDFTARLGDLDGVTLQTLVVDPGQLSRARTQLVSRGVYGGITVAQFDGRRLPYADNLVNLIVVHAGSGQVSVARDELMRVLVPGGVLLDDAGQQLATKPWPEGIDQWTHFLHSAAGNAVAADQCVAPATALQWLADPKYCRSHEIDSSLPAMISADGRLFYFLDEGPIGITDPRFPARWMLVARDAFNGSLLWKQPLQPWGWRQWKPEIGDADWRTLRGQRGKFPAEIPRRLVAVGQRVYVTLGFQDAPISILDAATGKLLKQCEGTEGTRELVVDNSTIFAKIHSIEAESLKRRGRPVPAKLMALDATTGEVRWSREVASINALSLAAADGRVVLLRGAKLLCFDQRDGQTRWEADSPGSNIVVIHKNVALTTGKEGTSAFSLDDGTRLWTGPSTGRDLLVIDDHVWRIQETEGILSSRQEHWPTLSRHAGAKLLGYDLQTGKLSRSMDVENAMSPGHHLRCYRSKATEQFIIYPKRGAEFLDLNGERNMRHDWLRGSCRFGILPCNGLLYTPPDQCFCYIGAKMDGLVATSSANSAGDFDPRDPDRLVRGPAYASVESVPAVTLDWPAFRADAKRSGSNRTVEIAPRVERKWTVELAGRLTQPTIAAGKVFVAAVDSHTIHAFDAGDGSPLWQYTAGGRVDSSPTYHDGLLLFGANDGQVYCLDASTGALVWQFMAAPNNRCMAAFGQFESPWPVHGSVLMLDSLAYFAAGRSTLVDGGAHFYALEPRSGQIVHYRHLRQPPPDLSRDIGEHFAMNGSNIDVLTTDGEHIFCMQEMMDKRLNRIESPWNTRYGDHYLGDDHLIATGGILDDTGFNRIFWSYGNRWPGFYFMLMAPRAGNLLVFDKQRTWATKWFVERNIHSALFFPETTGYLLFCDENTTRPFLVGDPGAPKPIKWLPETLMTPYKYDGHSITNRYDNFTVEVDKGAGFTRGTPAVWQEYLPVRIEAMALTRRILFAAGTPDKVKPDDPLAALEGRLGGVLSAIDPDTGKQLWQTPLPEAPRFDGLSAAGNQLFLVTRDGKLVAWH